VVSVSTGAGKGAGTSTSTPRASWVVLGGLVMMVAAILGFNMVALKFALVGSGPFTVQALAAVAATSVFFVLAVAQGAPLRLERSQIPAAFGAGMALTVGSAVLVAAGVERVSAGVASLLMSMTPVITLVLSALVLGERTNVIGLLGVAAGFLGVGVVAFTADRTIAAELLGVVFMLLGACAWSTGIVVMRRYARNIVPSTFVAWQTLFGVPVLFVLAFVFEGFVFEWSLIFVLAVLYAGVVSKGTSFFLQLRIVQLGTATTASLTAFLLPVFGTLAGVIVLGETVRAGQVAGGAVILVGVALVLRSRDDGGVPTPLPRTPAT